MAEGTIPPQASAAVDQLRASAGELGTELAWYADMTKKAFRGVSLSAVLGVFAGGLAVWTDQGVVAAPWERLEFLSRKHDMSIGTLNKNREDELIFAVAGGGELSVSHNRGKDNPGGPLEPVSELAESTYGTWLAARATDALKTGRPFAFGDVVVEPERVRLGGKTLPIDDTLEVSTSDRKGTVRLQSGRDATKRVSVDVARERISSPFALRVVLTVLQRKTATTGDASATQATKPAAERPAEGVRAVAAAAAERAGLGTALHWFGATSGVRRKPIALGVFDGGFIVTKEGAEPTVLPWSESTGVGPLGVEQPYGFVSVRVGRKDGIVEISSKGGEFPAKPEQVRLIAAELSRGYAAHSVRTLREAIERDGSVTFGTITIDARGLSRKVLRQQIRLDFADVTYLVDAHQTLPNQPQQASLVATEVSAASGMSVRHTMDVPSLSAFTALVRELMGR